MTTILLPTYLPTADFDDFFHQFYDGVCGNDLVKHYFVLARKNTTLQDMKRYWSYLTPKTALEYRRPATPTASVDIQLPESQFSEIVQVMARVCRERKVNPEHVPQLTHEILELIEETRSQTNDMLPSKMETHEVEPEKLCAFLKRYKIFAEVMPSKNIMVERGLSHKVWLSIEPEGKRIHIEGRIYISDAAFDDQINEIIERQDQQESFVGLRLERGQGAQHLAERHALSYRHGIPMRLFTRYLRRFSMDLDRVYAFDKEGALKGG
ncbi:MAG: hypothetical protein RL404_2683 [Pseudomonadota bacterium]